AVNPSEGEPPWVPQILAARTSQQKADVVRIIPGAYLAEFSDPKRSRRSAIVFVWKGARLAELMRDLARSLPPTVALHVLELYFEGRDGLGPQDLADIVSGLTEAHVFDGPRAPSAIC